MIHVYEDELAGALLDLMNRMNSPRQDDILLSEAGVTIDRALFPLLVRIARRGSISIVELADQVDRDPSTISRQVGKLERQGFVARRPGEEDQRVREAVIAPQGQDLIVRITAARRRLLKHLLSEWSDEDRQNLPRLIQRLTDAMRNAEANLALRRR